MAKNKNLQFLKPGDCVEIIAPASACAPEHLRMAKVWLEKQGFKVSYDQHILKPNKFLAQTDTYRFQQLKKALYNKKTKAIWCLRGGYSSFRLWPELLKLKKKPDQQKLFIGLSDITSLHQFLNQKWNWPTLHASLLDRVGQGLLPKDNELELIKVICGQQQQTLFADLKPLNSYAKKKQTLNGFIRGGNLVTFAASLGTPLQPKFKKKDHVILFFEEIGERGYKVDRLLQQLKMSGILNSISAVVFGDFIKGEEPNGQNFINDVLLDFAKTLSIPVLSGVQSGHAEIQRPLFFNVSTVLNCGQNAKMSVYLNDDSTK